MMKLSAALHQSYANRRSNSFSRSTAPLDSSVEKSQSSFFWLLLHGLCYLISLVLGFRFSRVVFFLLFSSNNASTSSFYATAPFLRIGTLTSHSDASLRNQTLSDPSLTTSSSRVVVGRHGILIRPWPHPDPAEMMKAHRIIERVQREQRLQYGIRSPKPLIAVTPTYVRTFQTFHLTGVMHWLMNAPYSVVWIVVEAGGTTNETAQILAKSGIHVIHIGFSHQMPKTWDDRHRMEAQMRLHALRVVREEKLEGIVMFADDSNMHSLELFDEIQKVKWIGALSISILTHSLHIHTSSSPSTLRQNPDNPTAPLQGPACNSSGKLFGWRVFNSLPYKDFRAKHIDERAIVLPQKVEWAELVINSRLIWKVEEDDDTKTPEWVEDLDSIGNDFESPLSLIKDGCVVEPLGNCGDKALIWWLRVEARTDSKFPPGWIIDPPLEVIVPARRTPWPDFPPELPSTKKAAMEKHSTRARSRHGTSRMKRKNKLGKQEHTQSSDMASSIM